MKYLQELKNRWDVAIIFVLFLATFGLFTISSFGTENTLFYKQMLWIFLAVIIMLIGAKINFLFLKNTKLILSFYSISLLLLLSTLIFGSEINGAKAWLNLGIIVVEPSDFMKISLIILLAKYLSKRHIEIDNIRHIIVSFIYTIIPVIVIMFQPDLGSALVLLFIWFVMMIVSGISKKHLFGLIIIGALSFILCWTFIFKDYQKDRILNLVNPTRDIRNTGYNVYQSQIAVGSGGLLGKNIGYGTQSRLSYLPEHETDFIFAAFVEEWGFVGGFLLILLFALFFFRLIIISYYARDNFQSFISMGFFAWIFFHFMINIGMNIGLLPVTGIPLPFVSYGGSHIIAETICLTIVLSFHKHNLKNPKRYMNNEFLGVE